LLASSLKMSSIVAESSVQQPPERVIDNASPATSQLELDVDDPGKDSNESPRIVNGTSIPKRRKGAIKAGVPDHSPDQAAYNHGIQGDWQGERLTRIKSDGAYEKGLKHNELSAPRPKKGVGNQQESRKDPKLASGRRAGAGWERSA
jgi:hypothetical protein